MHSSKILPLSTLQVPLLVYVIWFSKGFVYSTASVETAVFSVDFAREETSVWSAEIRHFYVSGNKYRTSYVTELDKEHIKRYTIVNTSKSFDGNMYEAFVSTNVNLNSTDRLYVYICNSLIDIPAKPLRQIVVMVEDESKDYITTLLKPTYYRHMMTSVTPINPTPSIVGCSEPLDCTFNVTSSGYLTCVIEGVLPIVHPKWLHYEFISSRITFSQPQLIVRNIGSLFSIYLTTYYEITTDQDYESETDEDWQAYDVTASCSVNYEVLGQHQTDVTLHLQKRTSAVTEDRIRERFGVHNNWLCVIPVSVIAVIMIIVFGFSKWRNGKAGSGACGNKNTSDVENTYKNNGEDNPSFTI
ncbi:hypothetical protein BSL78_27208 [Apostichopus japonicus]|uniref:Uncharacterized protein n=1 Tax=Stichopus japonicus TaxID=307972 RepID=A0A2G8JJN5_STIJA|nr:hypothetical protein BSL78_27208 [Apostichopus japonicus]